jgi:xylulokinase
VTDRLLAIDLGTSSTKLLVVSRHGEVLDRRRLPHATRRPTPDAAEQDPAEWWRNLVAGVTTMADRERIAAIGVTGQMHGLVVHGADGVVARPAITWEDRRGAIALPALLARAPHHPSVAPGYQAASWQWLVEAEPDIVAGATAVLLPKDTLVHRLTGRHVTDPSDAIGTGWYRPGGSWDAEALAAAGIDPSLLPELVPSGSLAGPLTREAATALGLSAGIPVITAGGDAAVAAFGAGATDPSTPLILLSTGCQALQPADSMPERDAWPAATPPGFPRWLGTVAVLNGGNVVGWARATLGDPASRTDPDLVFLPYLTGERTDRLSPDASGAFVGLRPHHDRPAMARAAIDGVSLALADAVARAGGHLGSDAPVLAGGGGTRDDAWLQSVADALGRTVAVMIEPDLSAWGAARSTATALGWVDPVGAPDAWRPATRPVMPGIAAADAVARLDRFRTIAERLFGAEHR